jgi:hypothetical protein
LIGDDEQTGEEAKRKRKKEARRAKETENRRAFNLALVVQLFDAEIMKTRPLRFIVAGAVPTLDADAVVRADFEPTFVNAAEGRFAVATEFGDDFLIDDRQTQLTDCESIGVLLG